MHMIPIPETAKPELEAWLQQHPEIRQPVEAWTRVMGYHRPISAFNPGKQSEHRERLPFVERAPLPQGGLF